jgi:uncharacterized protein (DUF2252 family)
MSAVAQSDSVLVAVLRFNEDRKARLVRLKLKRMARNPFAFFRGANHLFADGWNETRPPDVGPEVLICGDLHLENFGAYRDEGGEFLYDINDFDDALVAPCSLDLVRCSASILLAAELWRLTPLQASGMVLTFLDEYRANLKRSLERQAVNPEAPRLARGPVWDLLGKFAQASQAELLDQHTRRLRDGTRRIVRSKNRHPGLTDERAEAIRTAVDAYGDSVGRPEFYKALDVTGRVAGIGSLGLRRYMVLVAGGGSPETNRLLDLKECRPSALRGCATVPWPFPDGSDAARVVRAQKTLQARPAAGLDVLKVGDEMFRVREMIPEENRTSLDRFNTKPGKLRAAVEEAGKLTGLSHSRGAEAVGGRDAADALAGWAAGPALDAVFSSAARAAETCRRAHRKFRAERRSPGSIAAPLRQRFCR